MLALAFLSVTRAALADAGGTLASSANEIRCMSTALRALPRDEQRARASVRAAPCVRSG
jgi:hypothetical protein